jgi:hypothetical protein
LLPLLANADNFRHVQDKNSETQESNDIAERKFKVCHTCPLFHLLSSMGLLCWCLKRCDASERPKHVRLSFRTSQKRTPSYPMPRSADGPHTRPRDDKPRHDNHDTATTTRQLTRTSLSNLQPRYDSGADLDELGGGGGGGVDPNEFFNMFMHQRQGGGGFHG